MRLHALLVMCVPALWSCRHASEPGAQASGFQKDRFAIQTDAASYQLERQSDGVAATIGFVFTNPAGVRLYVVNCNGIVPPGLEKLVNGEWISAWSAIVPRCLSLPIVIDPGEEYSSQLQFFAGNASGNTYPKFETPGIAGTYRLVWHNVLTSYDDSAYPFGAPLEKEHRVSNAFTLTTP